MREIILSNKDELKIDNKKELEFRDKRDNYKTWRWNGVSLYQSAFIVFVTSAILIFIDIISKGDLIFKILTIILFAIISFELYKRMVRCASKPIFVADNMIATLEGEPKLIKGEDGKEYSVMKLSNAIYEEPKIKTEKSQTSKNSENRQNKEVKR